MIHNGTGKCKQKKEGGIMKTEKALERKIEKIKRDLMKLGDLRPGSLSVQT